MARAHMMVLALLLLNTLMAVLSLLVARSRRTTLALRKWGWGALAYSAGLAVTMMNFLGTALSRVSGNTLIAYAPIPMIAGVLLHTRYRLPMRWVWGTFVVTVAFMVGNALRTAPWVFVYFAAPAILSNPLFLGAGVALLLSPPKDAKLPARLLAVTCLFAAFIWTVRLLVLWLYLGASPSPEKADLTVSLFAIAQLVIAVSATLALVWIEQRSMEAQLERFLSPDVVEMIATNPDKIHLGGQSQVVTVLFADIRGFTTLVETLPPEKVVETLNDYFSRATDAILDSGGMLDKYLGDGLMAVFGAPQNKGNDADNAVKAAIAIQRLVLQLNMDAVTRGLPELRVGIGINTGEAIAGNIGSPRQIDYTVVGDTVNIAARLMANAAGWQILITEGTTKALVGSFAIEPLPPMPVKGKSVPIPVFSVAWGAEQAAAVATR